VDLPTKFDRFREVWGWDTEFKLNGNHRPILVTMFAKEVRSGREVRLRLADLKALGRLPFGNEPDTAVESYSAVAELNCAKRMACHAGQSPVHLCRDVRLDQRSGN
jgi:hypothetical protein